MTEPRSDLTPESILAGIQAGTEGLPGIPGVLRPTAYDLTVQAAALLYAATLTDNETTREALIKWANEK